MLRPLFCAAMLLGASKAHESTLANTLAAAPRQDLVYPGVLRYMREAGLTR